MPLAACAARPPAARDPPPGGGAAGERMPSVELHIGHSGPTTSKRQAERRCVASGSSGRRHVREGRCPTARRGESEPSRVRPPIAASDHPARGRLTRRGLGSPSAAPEHSPPATAWRRGLEAIEAPRHGVHVGRHLCGDGVDHGSRRHDLTLHPGQLGIERLPHAVDRRLQLPQAVRDLVQLSLDAAEPSHHCPEAVVGRRWIGRLCHDALPSCRCRSDRHPAGCPSGA